MGIGASIGERELLDGAEVAEGVARVHDAKVLLRKLSAVARVGIDRAEGVAGERVAVLERAGCRITNRCEELIERRIFPFFFPRLTPRVRNESKKKEGKETYQVNI